MQTARGENVRATVVCFVGVCCLILSAKVISKDFEGTMSKQHLNAEHRINPANRLPLGGRSTGAGFTINWAGSEAPDAADPLDVAKALQSRMVHLQATAAGSDRNAKALWEINKAVAILDGSVVEDMGAANVGGAGPGFGSLKGE